MKHIVKQGEPEKFVSWKALASPDWQPTYADLSGDIKQAVKDALKTEQGHICCYCEKRLTDRDSHIEHFRPQSDPAVDALDFSNMLCSCQNQVQKGDPLHCGNRKGAWFDSELLISPLDPTCECRFSYTGDGRIKPHKADDSAAVMTIEKLGLDIPKLRSLRKSALDSILNWLLTAEETQTFVTGYLRKDSSGQFGEFFTMVHFFFGSGTPD